MVWNELYISSSASGGDGSEGSPWTLAEWWVAVEAGAGTVPNGSRGNVKADGTHTQADIVITRDAADNAPIVTQGYTATAGDSGVATIERQAGEVGTWIQSVAADYINYEDLKFDSLAIGDGAGYLFYPSAGRGSVRSCEFTGGVYGTGVLGGTHHNVWIHGITCLTGILNARIFHSRVLGDLLNDSGQTTSGSFIFDSIIKTTGAGANIAGATGCQYLVRVILDGAFGNQGIVDGDFVSRYPAINCIFLNASASEKAVSAGAILINPVFYNNLGGNYDDTKATVINEREADPQFIDADNWDYRIRNRSLNGSGVSDAGMSRTNYSITPGVDQVAIIIPYSGDVIETENNYGYSGDPVRGTYVRASGDQTIEGTSWGEDGTEFTGLWETVIASEVQLAVTFGPSGSLTGTLDAITYSMPITLTVTAESLNISLEVS